MTRLRGDSLSHDHLFNIWTAIITEQLNSLESHSDFVPPPEAKIYRFLQRKSYIELELALMSIIVFIFKDMSLRGQSLVD
jgi:hypothetical protein